MKAMIFSAGLGTRLRPFTHTAPKALAKVNGIPLLQRNIQFLQHHGLQNFVINIHHFGEQIIDFLAQNQNFGAEIEISDERENLLETGGGLLFARNFLEKEEFFIAMNADILTEIDITKLIEFHKKNEACVSLAVSARESSRKLIFDKDHRLCGWRNENTGETKGNLPPKNTVSLAFSGIHCINGSIFEKMSRRGKFSIIDEYLDLMREEKIMGYLHESIVMDIGKPEAIQEAEKIFK